MQGVVMVPSSFMFRLREHLPGHPGAVQCRGVGILRVVCSKEKGPPGVIPGQLTAPTAQGSPELQCMDKGCDPEQLHCKEGAFLLRIAPVWLCSKFGVQKMLLRVGRKWAPVLGKKKPFQTPVPCWGTSPLSPLQPPPPDCPLQPPFSLPLWPPCLLLQSLHGGPPALPPNSPTDPKLTSSVCTWTAGLSGRNNHGGRPAGIPSP